MRLTFKLTLFLTVVVLFVLGSSGFLRLRNTFDHFQADGQVDHERVGRIVATAFERIWVAEGRAAALKMLSALPKTQPQLTLRWVEVDSHEPMHQARVPAAFAQALATRAVVFAQGRATLLPSTPAVAHTYVPVILAGEEGAIEIEEHRTMEHDALWAGVVRTMAESVAVTLAWLVVALLIGTVLVAVPMRAIADKARRVGTGDFGSPLALRQRDELGELAAAVDVMCDQLREQHERLNFEGRARLAAVEELRRAERLTTVGKLASGVAHELGTPLHVVLGRASMIETGEADPAETIECARIIREQSQRMAGIIRQLLDLSRQREPSKSLFSPVELAQRCQSLLGPIAEKKSVRITIVEPSNPIAELSADAHQLEQVLTNLVMNAIQVSPPDTAVQISVEELLATVPSEIGQGELPCVAFRVADHGRGIDPAILKHLFEPFFTTKAVGQGTGLGLSVSWGIVREHQGWIEVDNQPGKGACFSVLLPFGEPHEG